MSIAKYAQKTLVLQKSINPIIINLIMEQVYTADATRYDNGMQYARCGLSGIMLPKVSLGFWHNFGSVDPFERSRTITRYAFDHGVTHFDLANNYGPIYGSAEETLGRLMLTDFKPYRDELFISTKAGYDMWPGPYGDWGSRKYLLASLDQSLKRLGLDYVDIFYHHRMDPNTPLEETMGALKTAVDSGKALYVGLSNYDGETLEKATAILGRLNVPFIINQNRYSILDRTIEKNGLKQAASKLGKGIICFSTPSNPAPTQTASSCTPSVLASLRPLVSNSWLTSATLLPSSSQYTNTLFIAFCFLSDGVVFNQFYNQSFDVSIAGSEALVLLSLEDDVLHSLHVGR